MLEKLQKLGLLSVDAGLDNVLSLELKDVLEKRLQSVVFRKGLARTMKQARQFITHRHVAIGDKEITAPSFLVSTEGENKLTFKERSQLANEDHPERVNLAQETAVEAEAVKPKKSKKDKEESKGTSEKEKTKDVPKEKAEKKNPKKKVEKKEKEEESPKPVNDKVEETKSEETKEEVVEK